MWECVVECVCACVHLSVYVHECVCVHATVQVWGSQGVCGSFFPPWILGISSAHLAVICWALLLVCLYLTPWQHLLSSSTLCFLDFCLFVFHVPLPGPWPHLLRHGDDVGCQWRETLLAEISESRRLFLTHEKMTHSYWNWLSSSLKQGPASLRLSCLHSCRSQGHTVAGVALASYLHPKKDASNTPLFVYVFCRKELCSRVLTFD